ncbi:prepilin-type N-terminal cleavage/methylation domain-containing protein [Synechococcus sp. CS-1328]|uniref:prepilin-type N-terminal cleavage/methylation domain-containing protein n=1 Tax=Synechococcus sp. CS-1328 TaxID=2847976 RepID=UPI00223BF620|nr:prepilin-type N-terminal cleavage/methylation domain-containing protein [Synechococcus sp. CS-1328]MCT0224854.1 prepilin-type N-terminal cleavage/methylation domain-containing protein [Synechococcus sp. CS-1328]
MLTTLLKGKSEGFTLTEFMVVVVLIGIVGAVTISLGIDSWRRERLNAVVIELAGWLEEISRNPERNGTACTVTVDTGSRSPGSRLARVEPTSCSANPAFNIPATFGSDNFNVGSSQDSWTFTPRGAISSASDVQVRIAISGQQPVQCVRLSGTLGLIRLGRNEASSDVSSSCTVFSST